MVESVPLTWRLKKQKYNFIGSQCSACNKTFFPHRTLCPSCRRRGEIKDFQFSGKGEIESFTIIRVAPKGFESMTPYAVAIIKLEEGARISGQLVDDIENVEIGKKVKPVFRRLSEDGLEGVIHYGMKFEIND